MGLSDGFERWVWAMGLGDGFGRWVWAMGLGGGDFGGLGAEPGFYLDKLQIICKNEKINCAGDFFVNYCEFN